MKWSQLSSVQRAYLAFGAVHLKDTIKNGKVIRCGEARDNRVTQRFGKKVFIHQDTSRAKAALVETAKLVQRDADRAKAAAGKALMLALVAASNVKVTKLPHGAARGAGKPGWMGRRGMGGSVLPPGLFGGLRNGR